MFQFARVRVTVAVVVAAAALAALAPLACVSEKAPPPAAKKSQRATQTKITGGAAAGAPIATNRPEDAIGSASDPCADRLHAICGPLLLYYSIHRKMPARIEELRDIAGPDPDVEFFCPVSRKPYIYDAHGIPDKKDGGFLVIYDPEPSHGGLRWAISAAEPRNTAQPLVARVIAVPEATFHASSPPPTPIPAPAK